MVRFLWTTFSLLSSVKLWLQENKNGNIKWKPLTSILLLANKDTFELTVSFDCVHSSLDVWSQKLLHLQRLLTREKGHVHNVWVVQVGQQTGTPFFSSCFSSPQTLHSPPSIVSIILDTVDSRPFLFSTTPYSTLFISFFLSPLFFVTIEDLFITLYREVPVVNPSSGKGKYYWTEKPTPTVLVSTRLPSYGGETPFKGILFLLLSSSQSLFPLLPLIFIISVYSLVRIFSSL